MRCPKCGELEDKVIDSRLSKEGSSIRRRRECVACEFRFTTREEVEHVELRVVKRDGRREPFDPNKLKSGILKACEKRPVSTEAIEQASEEIFQDLELNYGREVPSQVIGAKVMEKLHELDEVAYVRYASVYRQFEGVGEFVDAIESLKSRAKPSRLQRELFP